jgi:hypothetical protein
MQAIILEQSGRLRLLRSAEPGVPGPGEALVRARQWHHQSRGYILLAQQKGCRDGYKCSSTNLQPAR